MKQPEVSEIVKQGSEMKASGDSKTQEGEQQNEKEGNEINKVTRPGRYSMINNKPKNSTGRPATKFGCTGCGNQAHPLGGHGPTRGKYCFRCQKSNHFTRLHPSRKPNHTGVQVKALGVALDWIQARTTQRAEEVLYKVTRESHKILRRHYN